eukprot:411284_1
MGVVFSKCTPICNWECDRNHCCEHDCFQKIKNATDMIDVVSFSWMLTEKHKQQLLSILNKHNLSTMLSIVISYLPVDDSNYIGDYHCYFHTSISSMNRNGIIPCSQMTGTNNYILPILKLLMLGSDRVGKTSLTNQFVNTYGFNRYGPRPYYDATVLLNVTAKYTDYPNKAVPKCMSNIYGEPYYGARMQIVDQSNYEMKHLIIGSQLFLIVFAVDSRDSFEAAKLLTKKVSFLKHNFSLSNWGVMLVGNKVDLKYNGSYMYEHTKYSITPPDPAFKMGYVSTDEAIHFAKQWNMPYIETSAKCNKNVHFMYRQIIWEWWIQSRHSKCKMVRQERNPETCI